MKKQTRRLNLNRETLGQLDSSEVTQVAGASLPICPHSGFRCVDPNPPPVNTMN